MSYEYKDAIQDSIIDYYDDVLLYNEYRDDVLNELDHVYAQAAKADEYEAKAKAFDRIVEQRKKTGVKTLGHYAFEIIREYEIGDYNA